MKKNLLISIFLLSLVVFSPTSVNSQTSQSQEYRLEQIEKLSATASSKTATNTPKTKSHSISFISGNVTTITNGLIFLETPDGTKTVSTSESTLFYNIDTNGKKLIGIGDIKVSDNLSIIGLSPTASVGFAKIIVRIQTKATKSFAFMGTISESNATNLKLGTTILASTTTVTTTINSETQVTNLRKQSLKITELLPNDKLVLAGYFDEKANLITNQILKLTTTTKTATSSAK